MLLTTMDMECLTESGIRGTSVYDSAGVWLEFVRLTGHTFGTACFDWETARTHNSVGEWYISSARRSALLPRKTALAAK